MRGRAPPTLRDEEPGTADDVLGHEPSRLAAIWQELRRPVMWTAGAFAALIVVVAAGTTQRGSERIADLPQDVAGLLGRGLSAPSDSDRLAAELATLRDEARRSAGERAVLERRVAEMERSVAIAAVRTPVRGEEIVTGSIPPVARDAPSAGTAEPATVPAVLPPRPAERPAEAVPPGSISLATRTLFGVDLGSEASVGALRLRWQRMQERHTTLLRSLEPIISARDGPNGQVQLHLVAGPFADVTEAAQLCARLRAAGAPACQPATYDGQRLALR